MEYHSKLNDGFFAVWALFTFMIKVTNIIVEMLKVYFTFYTH